MSRFVTTLVGDELRIIAIDVFLDAHATIADECRARGLTGRELDEAIVARLPAALAAAVGETASTRH